MKLKIIALTGLIILVIIASCQSDEQIEFYRYYSEGSLIYQNKCQNCHGKNGEGLLGLIPPLADSSYFKKNVANLACSVQYGLKGKITINNKTFDGEMPGNKLSPVEIAGVLTYIANSFGNNTGTLNAQRVEKDLNACR